MANIITEKRNCTENSGSTYSVSGTPLTTTTVFTKTFTVVSGFIFTTPPSINFAEVSDTSSYTVVINDTGSIAGGNLTVRSFVVKYKHPLKLVVGDRINFTAKAELNLAESSNKIYSFYIDQRNLAKQGETRDISIFGDPGATLVFDVKNASNSSIRGGASTITIPTNGLYVESIAFPGVVSSTTYSVILTQASSNTFLTLTSPTVVTLPQYAETTITFRLTEAASNFIVKLGTSHTSGVALTSKGNVGTRALSGVTIGYNFTDQKTHWSITPQSSLISIKKIGSITANDWTGTTNGSINTLTGGSLVAFGQQERTIYPTTTAVTIAQAFSNTQLIRLTGDHSAGIKSGMRVTGSGVTRSGATSLVVLYDSTYSGVFTSIAVSQTPGGTINAGTTLTFHTVMHINGDAAVNNFGTSSQNCDLDAAGILAFNEAPTAASQATISATRGQAKEVTLAATDPEGDALTFTITKLPVGGTLAYTDQNNSSATIACLGQTNQTIVLGNSKVVAYTSGNAGQSSSPQTLQFKANDGQQDSNIATLTFNLS
tara:strand:- start:2756 stop:4387 length:1632 start_codon:yes stop_codon:yes gene_type:complete